MAAYESSVRFDLLLLHEFGPVLREIGLGRMELPFPPPPRDAPRKRQTQFFQQSVELLQSRQVVGFSGGRPADGFRSKRANQLSPFQRGFCPFWALRAPVSGLAIHCRLQSFQPKKKASTSHRSSFSACLIHRTLFQLWRWHPRSSIAAFSFLFGYPLLSMSALAALSRQNGGSLAKEVNPGVLGGRLAGCCISAVNHPSPVNACQFRPKAYDWLTSKPLDPSLPLFVFLPGWTVSAELLRPSLSGIEKLPLIFDVLSIPADDLTGWDG